MAIQGYEAFQIHIGEKRGNVYPVMVRGPRDVTFEGTLPGDLAAKLDAGRWLERSLEDASYLRWLGSELFRALFAGEVLAGFRATLEAAQAQKKGLRIVLTLDPPELARLPWELLHSGRFEGFLARSAATPVVRHLSSPNPVRAPFEDKVLRVLVAVAQPEDFPPLGLSREEALAIARTLASGQGRTRVDILERVTRDNLKEALDQAEDAGRGYHLLHFVGHGTSDEQGGRLVFEKQDLFGDPVPAEQVAELLDNTSIRMVFLNACESGREGEPERPFYPFRGVAQACVNLGIRAALAMQVEIWDKAATRFARAFYDSLARGTEVEQALLDARRRAGKAEAAGWAVPVLYSRVLDGSILGVVVERIPWWKLLLLAAVALLGPLAVAALLWDLFFYVPPMASGFNVAVAQFGALDAGGHLARTAESQELSAWLYEGLERETGQLPLALRVDTRGPDQVRMVRGDDPNARAADAARLAAQHNATILVYGVITGGEEGYQVQPEFYISDESFAYGSEVTGPERLGKPVAFEPPLDDRARFEVNRKLHARRQALQKIVAGLANLAVGEYQSACELLSDAAAIPDWEDGEGKEVVYLLMGATQLRAYEREIDPAGCLEALTDAFESFAMAYELNPEYARNYLGLGAVLLEQGKKTSTQPGCVEEKLVDAWRYYSWARERAAGEPPTAHVAAKADYGLGCVHLVGYDCQIPRWSADEARRYFGEVIAAYEAEGTTDLLRLAGPAHAALGWIACHTSEDWPAMLAECRTAIELLESLPADRPAGSIARYRAWAAFAEAKLGQTDDAREDYRRAIRDGEGTVPPEDLAAWQAELDQLEKGAP